MKLYVAGPMTGIEALNFPLFFRVTSWLRNRHHEVSNPAEDDLAKGINPFLPLDHPDQAPFDREAVLSDDFQLVLDADGIVMLPDWHQSSGAKDEYHLARRAGKKLFFWNAATEQIDSFPSGLEPTTWITVNHVAADPSPEPMERVL